jgi:hypothetical protein
MGCSCFLCFAGAALTLCFGHLRRVELHADQILVYDLLPIPSRFHFSRVKELLWDPQEGHVSVILLGALLRREIQWDHFTSDAEAIDFVARANEAVRAYRAAGR